ncbi:hypothetical protein FFT09_09525 [Saccharomonospora piscinae]|uniref:hypothetical protein n=1 Tax=Saccharomonospora piscinae TaxID=687388 RepID=UPI001106B0BD|nr:hypothetical protein [Saccharomonospora piscinae]TLW93604.1 hypothetical protein FFT09_09525 [Saccharomonospora piscinae]
MPRIDIAERAGVGVDGRPRPTEDRVVVTADTAVVLDGATELRDGLPSGGWYSHRLARRLDALLRAEPERDLTDTLAAAIASTAAEYGLTPRHSPSSTVAMLRWSARHVDALVLADSPVVAFTATGPEVLVDDRLDRLRVAGALRDRAAVDRLRNSDGGFWVAEAVPDAARHALRRRWPRAEVGAAVLASDGVSIGVDTYRLLDWDAVLRLARQRGADAVLDVVREAEAADADARRWPRSKQHDDQALVLIDFEADEP